MSSPDIESAIGLAERALDSLRLWLFAATGLVVVGLVVEYAPAVRKLATDWRRHGNLIWELAGGCAIIIGVAGELVVSFLQSNLETDLRNANHQYIAISQHDTEQLRAENLRLAARIQPRRLDSQQQKSLTDLFAKFPGEAVRVSSYELDVESALLGLQILHAASDAKLPVDSKLMSQGALGGMTVGISVIGTNVAFVTEMIAVLRSFGFGTTPDPPPATGGASFGGQGVPFPIKIFVGVKPLPE